MRFVEGRAYVDLTTTLQIKKLFPIDTQIKKTNQGNTYKNNEKMRKSWQST